MWFFYALAVPALYSITNFIEKFMVDKKVKDPLLMTIIGGFIYATIGFVIFLFKGAPLLLPIQTCLLLLCGIFLALYLVPYFQALKLDDTSRVVPLFQFVPVIVLVLSYLFLKETLSLKQLIGFFVVFGGGFILSVEKIEGKLFQPRKTLWLMIISSFLYALVLIMFRFVVKTTDVWTTLSYEFMGGGLGSLILLYFVVGYSNFRKNIKDVKGVLGLYALNDGISFLAQTSEAYAMALVPVAFVSIVGSTQALFVLIYGLFLSYFFPKIIKEDIRKEVIGSKIISVLLIFVGLYLIYF